MADKFSPARNVHEVFERKDASSVKSLMQYFEPSVTHPPAVSGELFDPRAVGVEYIPTKPEPIVVEYPEPVEATQKDVHVHNEQTENLDPLRFIDLQLEVLRQLSANSNDRFLSAIPFDPRYKPMRDAAEKIRRQDRDTFRTAERKVKEGLDAEARFAGMSGGRVTARQGDPNFARQQHIADRYKQLEQFVRSFR